MIESKRKSPIPTIQQNRDGRTSPGKKIVVKESKHKNVFLNEYC